MKNSKRQKRKELRRNLYRELTPQEKDVRRKRALGSFFTLALVIFLILLTAVIIIPHYINKNTAQTEPSEAEPTAPPYFTVVLDPGHGFGTTGITLNETTEAQRSLDIAKKTKLLLEEAGYTVYLTREGEENDPITDAERAAICNGYSADAVISIHFCSDEGAYYSLISEKTVSSGKLAKFLSQNAKTDSESEFLRTVKTTSARLNLSWGTDDDKAAQTLFKGITDYAKYAYENGIV